MATMEKVAAKVVKLMSIYPTHGITLQGSQLPKAIVNGKVVFGSRVGGKRVAFKDNEAEVPEEWMEYTSESTGMPAGIRHTHGYRSEFIEKDKLVRGLKDKTPWALSFWDQMNRRRLVVTPALGELDKMEFLGIKPD
jgi:hypothetical protein